MKLINQTNSRTVSCCLVFLAFASCSKTEFSSGNAARKNTAQNVSKTNSDLNSQDDVLVEGKVGESNGKESGDGDPEEKKGTDPEPSPSMEPSPIDSSTVNCPGGEFNFKPVLDFESVAGMTEGKLVDSTFNQQLETEYGVSFKSINGGTLGVAKVAKKGDPEPKFQAWMSVLCYDKSRYNLLCNGGDAGSWILTTDKSMSTNKIEFEIEFKGPTHEISFDLADVDGEETWKVIPFDSSGHAIDTELNLKSLPGYGSNTGNNALKKFTISNPNANIARLHFLGTKSINIFGFGIDNIVTGIPKCAK